MENANDYREPWELQQAGETTAATGSLWKSGRFRIAAAILLLLVLSTLLIDTKRSSYEEDIVVVYTVAHELHKQEGLETIPINDVLFAVRAFVAGARTESRGFVRLDDTADIREASRTSLIGQRKAMEDMGGKVQSSASGAEEELMAAQIMEAITRFYGRQNVSPELAAEVLRHKGMDMKEIRAFLTQSMLWQVEKVYKYQIAIVNEEQRVRREMHRYPFGWLSGMIRGTYKYLADEAEVTSRETAQAAAPQAVVSSGSASSTSQNWIEIESSATTTSYIGRSSITRGTDGTVRYSLVINSHQPVTPTVSTVMAMHMNCATRNHGVLTLKNFDQEFGEGNLVGEKTFGPAERDAGVFSSHSTLQHHARVVCN